MKPIQSKGYYGEYTEVTLTDEQYGEFHEIEKQNERVEKKEIYHRAGMSFDDVVKSGRFPRTESIEETVLRRERDAAIYRAIDQLSPVQKRRILLYMKQHNYSDIARREGSYPSTVKKSIESALKKLAVLLSEWSDMR